MNLKTAVLDEQPIKLARPTSRQKAISFEADSVVVRPIESARSKITSDNSLQTSEKLANRHSRLLSVLPAGVVVIDGRGIVDEANKVAVELLGEPLVGEQWLTIIQRAFHPQPGDGLDMSLIDGRIVHIATSPLDAEPGQLVLLNDVTETRALQSKVSHLQRLSSMGEVVAKLAHQIRTPLASALLYISPLISADKDAAVQQKFAQRLRDSLLHMDQLVKDMLSFSRGSLANASPVRVDVILQQVEQQFNAQPDAENYHLEVHNQTSNAYVFGSQDALVSAINNLLNNARQACGDNGEISVNADVYQNGHPQTWIEIGVEDNGQGIAESDKTKILTPFFTTRSSGTGLGLAVVQSVAKAHKGHLWLDSVEGEGSTFSLRLPIYNGQVQSQTNDTLEGKQS